MTNCEEKVWGDSLGAIFKDMEIRPTSPGYSLAQMKSLNHEYYEGGQLFTAATLAFMEAILVVSGWQLMFLVCCSSPLAYPLSFVFIFACHIL